MTFITSNVVYHFPIMQPILTILDLEIVKKYQESNMLLVECQDVANDPI